MQDLNKRAIGKAGDEVRHALGQKLKRRVTDLDKAVAQSGKILPKNIKQSIKGISDAEKNLRHRPYVSNGMVEKVLHNRNEITGFVTETVVKASRKTARKRWLTSLFLSYSAFLLVLCGFWYVATQM